VHKREWMSDKRVILQTMENVCVHGALNEEEKAESGWAVVACDERGPASGSAEAKSSRFWQRAKSNKRGTFRLNPLIRVHSHHATAGSQEVPGAFNTNQAS